MEYGTQPAAPAILRSLDLSRNRIEAIAPHTFHHADAWNKLERLNISANRVKRLENCTFVNLFQLTSLDLSYNLLEEVWPESFATVVRSDDVTSCRITRMSGGPDGYGERYDPSPRGFAAWKDESVSVKQVKRSPGDGTSRPDYCPTHKWPALESVDLSHNRLKILHESTFRGALCGVRLLKIGDNSLEHLPRYVVEHLHDLEEIELQVREVLA